MRLNQKKMKYISMPHLEMVVRLQNYWKRVIEMLSQLTRIHVFNLEQKNLRKDMVKGSNFLKKNLVEYKTLWKRSKKKKLTVSYLI